MFRCTYSVACLGHLFGHRSHLGGLLPISSCKKELPPAPSEISIFPRERTGQQFSPSTYPLGSLPPELIMLAFGYLIVVSRVYTNKAPDQSRLSRREKWLIIHARHQFVRRHLIIGGWVMTDPAIILYIL